MERDHFSVPSVTWVYLPTCPGISVACNINIMNIALLLLCNYRLHNREKSNGAGWHAYVRTQDQLE